MPKASQLVGGAEAEKKLEGLLSLAKGRKSFLAQAHDFPDPDTIASSLGLVWLLHEKAGIPGVIGYGGVIGRAENRAMVKVLGIKLKKVPPAEMARFELVALLDTQLESGNHSIPDGLTPDIVVDHHFERETKGVKPPFLDVGGGVGATSTKITQLIRASGLTPPTDVATALFYGVKSDTMDLARVTTPADVDAYLYLFPLIDRELLSEIEHPQVPLDYFRVFNKAIERGKIHGSFIVADLGEVYTPELCAELADRLQQIEGVRHALATGWFEDSLYLSLRTRSRNRNAGKTLHTLIAKEGYGTAGGHRPMAGARLEAKGKSARGRADLRRKIIGNILKAFGEDHRHFQRIVKSKTKRSNGAT